MGHAFCFHICRLYNLNRGIFKKQILHLPDLVSITYKDNITLCNQVNWLQRGDVTWLAVPGAKLFPGNNCFGHCYFFVDRACVGYMFSAGRERKGICSSACQLAVFLCALCFYSHGLYSNRIHSLLLHLDYCLQYLKKWAWDRKWEER